MKTNSKNEKSLVKLNWATFCRAVLRRESEQEDSERTIQHVLPSVEIQLLRAPEMPPVINLGLGNVAIYALFQRVKGFDGDINTTVELDSNFPFAEAPRVAVVIPRGRSHSQITVNVQNLSLPIKTHLAYQVGEIYVQFKHGTQILGQTELRWTGEIVEKLRNDGADLSAAGD